VCRINKNNRIYISSKRKFMKNTPHPKPQERSRHGKFLALILVSVMIQMTAVLPGLTQEYQVSEPRLELEEGTLHIYYDIVGTEPGQRFYISMSVEDENGKSIAARQLSGDVGENVRGGMNNHIAWEYEKDNVFLDAEIFIKVNAELTTPPVTVEKQAAGDEGLREESSQDGKSYSRTGLVLQSVALPGLGLTKVTGKPHWIKGVAGYGCIAGSVVLNRMAISTYQSISDFDTAEESKAAYDKSVTQDNASEILAYVAIGIWVTDLIWTVVGTSSLSDRLSYAQHRGFSLTGDLDPVSRAPKIGLVYRF